MKKVCILTSREVGQKCIEFAKKHVPKNFEITEEAEKADILISVMYDKILPQTKLENKKCYNFHPGVLPEYRGVGINSWTIINQETKAGVTLHIMDRGVDTGDIIEIREILIRKTDTAYSLFLRIENLIYKMFKDWLLDILNENYFAVPQKSKTGKTYYSKDLQKVKNLTKYARAFTFPGKESAYYYNENMEKIFLKYNKESLK